MKGHTPAPEECLGVVNDHDFEREVRDHPLRPDRSQDRVACTRCGHVLYDWGRAFKRVTV